jgi:hypothetical protein
MIHRIPAGEIKYLTVDKKALETNQRLHRENFGRDTGKEIPPCWIQVGDDKQNKINCWRVGIQGPSIMVYGHPRVCGAMVYVETTAELEYEI